MLFVAKDFFEGDVGFNVNEAHGKIPLEGKSGPNSEGREKIPPFFTASGDKAMRINPTDYRKKGAFVMAHSRK